MSFKVVTYTYFGSDDAAAVAAASDNLQTQPGVSITSHAVFLEREAFPSAWKNRMVGISIADVDDDQALDNARRTLLGTGAEIHIAKALQITPGKAVQHMGQYPPPPGVDAKS